MSSTSITDERLKNTVIALNRILQAKLISTTSDAEANVINELLIRIQTDTELLNAIIKFNESFLALSASWYSSSPSTSNAHVLTRMLLTLMP